MVYLCYGMFCLKVFSQICNLELLLMGNYQFSLFDECRLCVISGHITPIDVITHVPILCEESDIPYIYVPSKEVSWFLIIFMFSGYVSLLHHVYIHKDSLCIGAVSVSCTYFLICAFYCDTHENEDKSQEKKETRGHETSRMFLF